MLKVLLFAVSAAFAGGEARAQTTVNAGAAFGASFVARVFDLPEIGDGFTITGADSDGLNASVYAEVAGPHPGWLSLRGEAMYNRLTSPASFYAVSADNARLLRMALTDQVFALSAALVARATPAGVISPYVIVSGGAYHTRLGTNPDSARARVTETRAATGLGVSGGVGAKWQKRDWRLHVEARWHEVIGSTRGSGFVPLTLGLSRTFAPGT